MRRLPAPFSLALALPAWTVGQDAGWQPGEGGLLGRGRNFAIQNYLALDLRREAHGAADSAVLALADRIAGFLGMPFAATYGSGHAAIREGLGSMLAPGDSVILDAGCPFAMFETAWRVGVMALRSPAGSVEGVERRLRRLRRDRRSGKVWVAVPGVSAFGSEMAEVAELLELCRQHGARLIVDVSHDLGAMAQGGGGVLELQGCMGRVDVVLGSLAKCFGVAGGFVAVRDDGLARPAVQDLLANASARNLLAGFEVMASAEGRRRRRCLHGAALRLRNHLMAAGLPVMGQPSPLVPVLLPWQTAWEHAALLQRAGVTVPLLRSPEVPRHAPRWWVALSSAHGLGEIDDLADLMTDVVRGLARQGRSRTRAFVD